MYYYTVSMAVFQLIYNEMTITTHHHKRKLDGHIVNISTYDLETL